MDGSGCSRCEETFESQKTFDIKALDLTVTLTDILLQGQLIQLLHPSGNIAVRVSQKQGMLLKKTVKTQCVGAFLNNGRIM